MKYVFIYPPLMLNLSPLTGIPQLMGILESNGIASKVYDLNTDFLTNYFNEEFFKNTIREHDFVQSADFINNIPLNLRDNFLNNLPSKKDIEKHSVYFSKRIDFCNYVLKDKSLFYNHLLSSFALNVLTDALCHTNFIFNRIYELLLPNIREYFSYTENDIIRLDVNFLKYYISSEANIYKEYAENKIKELLEESPNCIGVSINTHEQFLAGLTFAYYLKQLNTNIHINIGGAFFNYFYKHFSNLSEIIDAFCDTISIGSNDNTVVELMKYINKEQTIENVPNILCNRESKVFKTKPDTGMNLANYPKPSFNGYKKSDYISSEFVLPIQASVSCYWGKCKFCNCNRDRLFQTKTPEKFVEEIEFLSNRYDTKCFYMWDNALHPDFMNRVTDLLIQKKLNIKYSFYARLEKNFDIDLLKKIKKSGCVSIIWGLDSTSEKILKYIDKGIDLNIAKKVLKNSYKTGISNTICLIVGFPTQTVGDLESDILFFKENKKYIDKTLISPKMFIIDGAKFADNKKEVQEQIKLPKEEIKKHFEKLDDLHKDNLMYSLSSTFYVLYATRYGILLNFIHYVMKKCTQIKPLSSAIIHFYMSDFLKSKK